MESDSNTVKISDTVMHETRRDLLVAKLESQQKLQSNVLAATTIHLLVAGAIGKFALESEELLSNVAYLLGGVTVAYLGLKHIKVAKDSGEQVQAEIAQLNRDLGCPLTEPTRFLPLTFTLAAGARFCWVAMCAFVIIVALQLLTTR